MSPSQEASEPPIAFGSRLQTRRLGQEEAFVSCMPAHLLICVTCRRQFLVASRGRDDGIRESPGPMDPLHIFRRSSGSSGDLDLNDLADEQLMAQLKEGRHDALAVLFDRYHRLVFSIALRFIRDRGEAEDVMQNVFFEIFRAVTQFDPSRGSTRVWILQYAYHRAISRREYLNTRSFYHQEEVSDFQRDLAGSNFAPSKLNAQETEHLLQKGLATLTVPQRTVIQLASFEGLTMAEIAAEMQESVVNVRNHYYRGLRKLRFFVESPPDRQKATSHG
jgi:RNA polymerase sigma-70 factor, ECF subfamily